MGKVIAVSALTSAVVSIVVVWALSRYGAPLLALGSTVEAAQPVEMVDVPDLIGLLSDAARRRAEGAGLRIVVANERPDQDVPAGRVVEQSPAIAEQAESGSAVRLVLSSGAGTVAVPDIVGRPVGEARGAIEAVGLRVGAVNESGSGTPGTVTASIPGPGIELERGGGVALTVVPSGVEVPRVTGMHVRRAQRLLEDAGLRAGRSRYRYDEDHGPYIVLEQDPAAGGTAPPGAEVSLVVNQGD